MNDTVRYSQFHQQIVNPSYRTYKSSDYKEIMELWKSAGLIVSLSDNQEELEKLAFKTDNKFILLELENRIIGTVICAHDGRRGYIHHLAVLPEFQKNGFGNQLMDEAIKHYKSLKTVKTHIFIEKSNSKVVDFYKHIDFKIRDDLILMTLTMREE